MMDIKTLLEDEIDILYTTLDRLKIYDIRLSHTKDGRIFAKDADSQWTGKNFYKFLLNDAIVYNQDGTSSVLTEHTLTSLRQLGKHYGAAFPFMELEENPIKYAEMSIIIMVFVLPPLLIMPPPRIIFSTLTGAYRANTMSSVFPSSFTLSSTRYNPVYVPAKRMSKADTATPPNKPAYIIFFDSA